MTEPAVCGAERLHAHGGVRAIACDREPGHAGDHAGWCRECELANDDLSDGWGAVPRSGTAGDSTPTSRCLPDRASQGDTMTDNRTDDPFTQQLTKTLRGDVEQAMRPAVDQVIANAIRPWKRFTLWLLVGYLVLCGLSAAQFILLK